MHLASEAHVLLNCSESRAEKSKLQSLLPQLSITYFLTSPTRPAKSSAWAMEDSGPRRTVSKLPIPFPRVPPSFAPPATNKPTPFERRLPFRPPHPRPTCTACTPTARHERQLGVLLLLHEIRHNVLDALVRHENDSLPGDNSSQSRDDSLVEAPDAFLA